MADTGRRLAAVKRRDGGQVENDRVTVSLIPKASAALDRLVLETGMSRTEITNRAIQLYAFVTDQLEAGKEVQLRDPTTDRVAQVQLF